MSSHFLVPENLRELVGSAAVAGAHVARIGALGEAHEFLRGAGHFEAASALLAWMVHEQEAQNRALDALSRLAEDLGQ